MTIMPTILNIFHNETCDLKAISLVSDLYEATAGAERNAFIAALGAILEQAQTQPIIAAQVLYLATSQEIHELAPVITKLSQTSITSDVLVRELARYNDYLASQHDSAILLT